MEVFGGFQNATALISQTFELYRHVSASQNFANIAGSYSAMIAFEYLRFETWVQQSGFLHVDLEGNPTMSINVTTSGLSTPHRRWGSTLDASLRGSGIHKAISEVYLVLEQLLELKREYGLDQHFKDPIGRSLYPVGYSRTDEPNIESAILSPRIQQISSVVNAISDSKKQREYQSKRISFFKKIGFGWALTDIVSDREKIASLIKDLKYWNDGLREMLPLNERAFNNTLVKARALSLSEDAEDLEQISRSAHMVDGELYGHIWKAADIKSQRLHSKKNTVAGQQVLGKELSKEDFIQIINGPGRELTSYLQKKNGLTTVHIPVLIEWTIFDDNLSLDEFDILKSRINKLCSLLANPDVPSSMLLPHCVGYVQQSQSRFIFAYELPQFACPHEKAISLYSMLRGGDRSAQDMKDIFRLPSLDERYQLAAVLADGLLSLLSMNWVHKGLNSNNIVMFYEKNSPKVVTYSKPQMMGFGIARPEEPGETTIEVRSLDSRFSLWQHPELRQGPHRRYERRHDIYSLGMILFEIGMWRDLHLLEREGDSPTEFHRRVVNSCRSKLGHYMGISYQNVVLNCIDRPELWLAAETENNDSASLIEVFSWDIVRELHRCAVN